MVVVDEFIKHSNSKRTPTNLKRQVSFYYFIPEVNHMEMILFTTGFAVTLATVLIVEACID